MNVGLLVVGCEEGDCGFGVGDCQASLTRPLRHNLCVGGEGTGGSRDVGRGVRVGEVISV